MATVNGVSGFSDRIRPGEQEVLPRSSLGQMAEDHSTDTSTWEQKEWQDNGASVSDGPVPPTTSQNQASCTIQWKGAGEAH